MLDENKPSNCTKAFEKDICRILDKVGALKFGAFKLNNGIVTPYYINLRLILSFPTAFRIVSDIFIKVILKNLGADSFDRICGIPISGSPLASVTAYHLSKPFLYTRQKIHLSGRERRVEGILLPGDRVLLIDDLVSTGSSLITAAQALRAEGGVVLDSLVLLDRDQGGKQRLSDFNINLHSVLSIKKVAKQLYKINSINQEQLKIILKQRILK
jgi:uridine monophosphate synthetase